MDLIKTWAVFGGAVITLILSTLPFYTFNERLGWLMSVVVTEYGLVLGLVTLIVAERAGRWRTKLRAVAAVFIASALVFLMPTLQFVSGVAGWERQMSAAFGARDEVLRPNYLRLLIGGVLQPRVSPREITFSPGLTLDLYASDAPGPRPWMMVIHGGGWDSGDARQMPELNSYLTTRGFNVVSINYALAPDHPWPAARDDAATAARYLREHARELNLDPGRWVVLGRSAGGQVAEALAFTVKPAGLRGLVALYAPSDMNNGYAWGREDDILNSRALLRAYLGGPPEDQPDAYRAASGLQTATKDAPPTLLLHGARDPLVWDRHSELLVERLRQLGVPATLIRVPWGTHGFDYNLNGPGGQTLTLALDHFLDNVLRD